MKTVFIILIYFLISCDSSSKQTSNPTAVGTTDQSSSSNVTLITSSTTAQGVSSSVSSSAENILSSSSATAVTPLLNYAVLPLPDFAFTVFNQKDITFKLTITSSGTTIPYAHTHVAIIDGSSLKTLATLITNANGEAVCIGSILSSSMPKVGVSVSVPGVPLDTLWYTQQEIDAAGRVITIGYTTPTTIDTNPPCNPATDPTQCITCLESTLLKKSRYAFEDKFPDYGDFDFNDLVADMDLTTVSKQCAVAGVPITDTAYGIAHAPQLVSTHITLRLIANGAQSSLGFAVSLGTNIAATTTVSHTASKVETISGETIIDFFKFARGQFTPVPNTIFVNTILSEGNSASPAYTSEVYTATVTYTPGTPITKITINPFIYDFDNLTKEIHLKGFPLTARGATHVGKAVLHPTIPFADIYGLPWGIEIDQTTKYPVESIDITTAYPQFITWAVNGSPADWASSPTAGSVY